MSVPRLYQQKRGPNKWNAFLRQEIQKMNDGVANHFFLCISGSLQSGLNLLLQSYLKAQHDTRLEMVLLWPSYWSVGMQ